jgi:predicted transcriptional regulator YdeE
MRVIVIVKATAGSEAGDMPSEELLAAMGKYNEELVNAGIMLAGEGLHPSSKGARVRFSGKNRTVTDGPFAETKELIAGFWLWKVGSMQEAIEWVKRCPNPMNEDSDIEIRPIFEADDFGDTFTPELRESAGGPSLARGPRLDPIGEQEARIRAQAQGLGAPRFENSRELLIAGLNESYTFESRRNIPAQWNRFVPHLGKIPGQSGKNSFGVCWYYKPERGFDYLSGVEVSATAKLPAGFTHVRLPQQRYAVFEHRDHVSSIGQTIDAIWTKWAPDCGLKLANSPCFERYTEKFDPKTGVGGMEIWIPLAA